jgi:hypothetical protein
MNRMDRMTREKSEGRSQREARQFCEALAGLEKGIGVVAGGRVEDLKLAVQAGRSYGAKLFV